MRFRPSSPRIVLAPGLLVLAILAVQGSLLALSGFGPAPDRVLFGDERTYWRGANEIAAGADWHPDPLWPPLYPRFLAAVLGAGGSPWAIIAVQLAMLVAVALLLADLARRWSGSRIAGRVTGALVLLYPPLGAFAHYLWPELAHLFLFVTALWILAARHERPTWLIAAGLLLGLALLTKSLLGPFLPILLLPLALEGRRKHRLLRLALVTCGIALVLAPVVADNRQRSTGVWVADSSAFNLWVGLNDRARKSLADPMVAPGEWRTYKKSAPTFPERRQILWRKIRDLASERGIPSLLGGQLGRQYFRLFDKDSFFTDQLPGGVIVGHGGGYRDPPPAIAAVLRGATHALYAAILVGAVAGMVVRPPKGNPWLWVGLAFLAYNLAIFLLLHVKSRYRVQLLPFLFLYCGWAAAWAAARLGLDPGEAELWQGETGRRAWLVAAPAALLLLFLAFGRPLLD